MQYGFCPVLQGLVVLSKGLYQYLPIYLASITQKIEILGWQRSMEATVEVPSDLREQIYNGKTIC